MNDARKSVANHPDRIEILTEAAGSCRVFADIGCDHGYACERMLKTGACEYAIASDVSEKCLKKAQGLLKEYIDTSRAAAIVSNGFENLPPCDVALIAGMGGEEIVGIIDRAKDGEKLPEKMVLQPMKNADKVRKTAVKQGYKILSDRVYFVKDKYYIVIVCERGVDELTAAEIEFGRTNLTERPEDFKRFLREEIAKLKNSAEKNGVLSDLDNPVHEKIKRYEKYVED